MMDDGAANRQVSVERVYTDNRERLGLLWVGGKQGGSRVLTGDAALKPTVGQVGHMNFIHPFRIQILGAAEAAYLRALPEDELRRSLNRLFTTELVAVVVANDETMLPYLLQLCDAHHICVFTSSQPSPHIVDVFRIYLGRVLAESTTLHGVFLDVLEMGVLIKTRALGQRAGLAEARDAGVDQARVIGAERLIVDAQAVLHIGAKVLDHHVGGGDQSLEHRDALGQLQVQRHRALVAVGVLVIRAGLAAQGVVAAQVLGHLHLDHIGAPIGELATAGGAGAHLRQIDDAKALQGGGGGEVGHGGLTRFSGRWSLRQCDQHNDRRGRW